MKKKIATAVLATMMIVGMTGCSSTASVVNYNLTKNGFASDTGLLAESGYCKYPIVLLNMEKIREYGEEFQ